MKAKDILGFATSMYQITSSLHNECQNLLAYPRSVESSQGVLILRFGMILIPKG
jgi:hypothetical protein